MSVNLIRVFLMAFHESVYCWLGPAQFSENEMQYIYNVSPLNLNVCSRSFFM